MSYSTEYHHYSFGDEQEWRECLIDLQFDLFSSTIEDIMNLQENSFKLKFFDSEGRTYLHFTAYHGDVEKVIALIYNGMKVNATSMLGGTPLFYASAQDKPDIVKALLDHGAFVDINDFEGETPLELTRNPVCKQLILQAMNNEKNLRKKNEFTRTFAFGGGLMERDILRDKTLRDMQNLFEKAIYDNNIDFISQLIEYGADVNSKNPSGLTPLHFAAGRGNLPVVKLLIEKGARIDEKDAHQKTPLYLASEKCFTDTCKFLLEKGANPNVLDTDGWSIISTVASLSMEDFISQGRKDATIDDIKKTLDILIQYGACINSSNADESTPIDCCTEEDVKKFLYDKMYENARREIDYMRKEKKRLLDEIKKNKCELVRKEALYIKSVVEQMEESCYADEFNAKIQELLEEKYPSIQEISDIFEEEEYEEQDYYSEYNPFEEDFDYPEYDPDQEEWIYDEDYDYPHYDPNQEEWFYD